MFCSSKERHFLNLFLWKDNFPEIVAAGGVEFAVIGDPTGRVTRDTKNGYSSIFSVIIPHTTRRRHRSAYFVEYGIRLLRYGGALGCVMSNRALRFSGRFSPAGSSQSGTTRRGHRYFQPPDDRQMSGLCVTPAFTHPRIPSSVRGAGAIRYQLRESCRCHTVKWVPR